MLHDSEQTALTQEFSSNNQVAPCISAYTLQVVLEEGHPYKVHANLAFGKSAADTEVPYNEGIWEQVPMSMLDEHTVQPSFLQRSGS